MSFSSKVKEELVLAEGAARHCRLAELAALASLCGYVCYRNGQAVCLEFHAENEIIVRKCFTLLEKTFNIRGMATSGGQSSEVLKEANRFQIRIQNQAIKICQALKLEQTKEGVLFASSLIAQNTCCKRAFIRGAFLAAGSISDPRKAYHFEVVFLARKQAEQLRDMINSFSMEAKVIVRKKYYVVYVKEGSQIADLLNIMGAHVALMDFENIRILKEMRNSINRQVNCDAANINKTVRASAKQIDDIIYIRDSIGFSKLTKGLEEIAELRIEHPEASLKELGEMMSVPLGKSGVNHRLKRLSSIADDLRELKEDLV